MQWHNLQRLQADLDISARQPAATWTHRPEATPPRRAPVGPVMLQRRARPHRCTGTAAPVLRSPPTPRQRMRTRPLHLPSGSSWASQHTPHPRAECAATRRRPLRGCSGAASFRGGCQRSRLLRGARPTRTCQLAPMGPAAAAGLTRRMALLCVAGPLTHPHPPTYMSSSRLTLIHPD